MSDFLQFVDRIPTLPNRKKLTFDDQSIKYATLEYADEPIEEGTFLNKANFNKLNLVLGYNEVTGTYNPATQMAEFTLDVLNEDEIVNNQRALIQCMNKVSGPATDFNVVKSSTSIGSNLNNLQLIEMSNGNIMIVGSNSSSSGYIAILDQQGNVVKSSTSIGSNLNNLQLIEMSNGNIMIVGYNSSNSGYIAILDQQGNVVKSSTSIGDYFGVPQLIEMSNGNIMIVGNDLSGNYTGYFVILDQQGNVVVNKKIIGNLIRNMQLIEMSNGNIMVTGYGQYAIISKQGVFEKNLTSFSPSQYFNSSQLIEMSNGNIMIVGNDDTTNRAGRFIILDQQGNVISDTYISIGNHFQNPQLVEMSNGNIMIVGYDISGNYTGYIVIVDNQGNIVKSSTSIGDYFGVPQLIEMSNGNIMIVGLNIYNRTGYITILDNQGNIVKSSTSIVNHFQNPQLIEMSNGNIMIVGYNNSSPYTGYIFICEPISTTGNASLNGIELDTFLVKDKYYELVYNETLDKFIAEEVRNAN